MAANWAKGWLGSLRRAQAWLLYALAALIVAGALAGMWRLGARRWICVDEFEHLHAAWSITPAGGGLTPYRDYFEHHTPLLYYGLAPVLSAMRPEQSFENGWAAVVMSRRIMWVLVVVTLLAIYKLGKAEHSRAAGALGAGFALLSMKVIDRMVEIRPDVISVPCILGALWLTLRGIRATGLWAGAPARPRGELWRFFGAGALFGLAVLATPKTLFALLGYTPAMAWFVVSLARRRGLRRAGAIAGVELAGFALPIAVMLAVLALRGAAWEFVEHNFLLNARWRYQFTMDERWDMLGQVVYENPFLAALGMVGLLAAILGCVRRAERRRGQMILAATAVGLIAGVFIIPVAYDEYFLMLIPLLAIFEAGALLAVAGHVRAMLAGRMTWVGAAYIVGAMAAVGAVVAYWRPPLVASGVDRAVWMAVAVGFVVLLAIRLRQAAVAALVVGMLSFGLPRFGHLFDKSNESTRRSMRYVQEHTRPGETIMDGWDKITAPFRPHAWRYFFLHREVRPMVSEAEWAGLRDEMRGGRFRPALIVWDKDNQDVPKAVAEWIVAHYEPIPAGEVPTNDPTDAPLLRPRASW